MDEKTAAVFEVFTSTRNLDQVMCPFFHGEYIDNESERCCWTGIVDDLSQHIQENHEKLCHQPLQITSTTIFKSRIIFSHHDGSLVICILDFNENLNSYCCSCLLSKISNTHQRYKYEIQIVGIGGTIPLIFGDDNITFIERITMLNTKTLKIPICSFGHLLEKYGGVNIYVSVKKTTQKAVGIDCLSIKPSSNADIFMTLMDELECSICTNFMSSPIHTCIEGHIICEKCLRQIEDCPFCRAVMLGGRNFFLEKLSSFVVGPCINRRYGCFYSSTISKVKVHEENCYFTLRECFYDGCSWNGKILDMPEHFEEKHAFSESGIVYTYELQKEYQQYIFLHDNNLFLLCISVTDEDLCYNFHHIGETKMKYQYEIQLIEPFEENDTLCFIDTCKTLSYNFEINQLFEYVVPLEMIWWFSHSDNILKFSIKVTKIC